ncbi:MAG: hypothetical protein PHU85_10885 [Phycisphaerae bacterium]|nr:hypothetical protein [Phycisphaerae bacterium]
MDTIKIGALTVGRFILGSNPFSGFSHQGSTRDAEMEHYYTCANVKAVLRAAEKLGITAVIARGDRHVVRTLMEYWDEGGTLQWMAQTCPGVGPTLRAVQEAIRGGAKAIHIHGGVMDNCLANGDMSDPLAGIAKIREAGLPVGIAGHNPEVFRWAEREKLDVDYYMCSYYNSAHRDKGAEKSPDQAEWFLDEDRRIMAETIAGLSRPVIHYKVMAAGRNQPAEAFAFTAKAMRPTDGLCVGVFPKDKPAMLAEDVHLFEQSWSGRGKR